MQRIGGFRRKTRSKLCKSVRQKGKISLTKFFTTFKPGDRVCLLAEPGYQNGMYKMRFYGKYATVKGVQGRCYLVDVMDGSKQKRLIVHPVHLRKV